MKLTRQHHREARLLWKHVTIDGIPDEERIRAAVATIHQQSGRAAEAVLKCFAQRLAIYIRSNRIHYVSATPLSPAQQEAVVTLGAGTESVHAGIEFVVDPSIIGGMRLERGYQVTDKTIARQLEILRDTL